MRLQPGGAEGTVPRCYTYRPAICYHAVWNTGTYTRRSQETLITPIAGSCSLKGLPLSAPFHMQPAASSPSPKPTAISPYTAYINRLKKDRYVRPSSAKPCETNRYALTEVHPTKSQRSSLPNQLTRACCV